MPDINFLAVVLAAAVSWIAGAFWYMSAGKAWMAALGKTKEDLMGAAGKPSMAPFVISLAAELAMAFVLAIFIGQAGSVTVANGLFIGLVAWIGFVATTMIVNHSYARMNPMLTVIDGGHWLAVLLLQGAVIGAFGT
jgi:hypothetical protein